MSGIYILALASIFVILAVLVFKSLKPAGIFSGPTTLVLTLCTALLAILGLARFESLPAATTTNPVPHNSFELDLVLLPYGAMAIATLLTLLVCLFLRLFGRKHKPWQSKWYDLPIDHKDKQPWLSHGLDKPSVTRANKIQQGSPPNRVERKK
jgi:hypothetical protein